MATDLIGKKLGQYEIKDLLGKGGMALVFRATQSSMKRDVAIKVMTSELGSDPEFVQRFEREAELFAVLQHPHILPVIDFGHEADRVYIVMRLVEGGSLDQRIKRGAMELPVISKMITQVGSALHFAHMKGIIHRDLKPNNVLLDDHDNAYLTDFGIAKMLAGTSRLTATNTVLGTPAYMAPEQWRGEHIDARSDIYSLGIMTYEMVTGRLPFEADTTFTLMYKHFNDPPPSPRLYADYISPLVENMILRSIEKDPADRFQSAESLAEAFRAAVEGRASDNLLVVEVPPPPKGDEMPTMIGEQAYRSETPTPMPPGQTPRGTPGAMRSTNDLDFMPTMHTPLSTGQVHHRTFPTWLLALGLLILAGAVAAGLFLAFGQGGDDNVVVDNATNTISPTPRNAQAQVLAQQVSVHETFDDESPVIATLSRGDEVQVVARTDDGTWYRVLAGSELGWVEAETISISGNEGVIEVVVLPTPSETPEAVATVEPSETPTEIPADTNTPEAPTETNTAQPPTATNTPQPPTNTEQAPTNTPEPASTNTSTPAPVTNTPEPVVTETVEPPPATPDAPPPTEIAGVLPLETTTLPSGMLLRPAFVAEANLSFLMPADWQGPVRLGTTAFLAPAELDMSSGTEFYGMLVFRGDPEPFFEQFDYGTVDPDITVTLEGFVTNSQGAVLPDAITPLEGYHYEGAMLHASVPGQPLTLDFLIWDLNPAEPASDWLVVVSISPPAMEYETYRTDIVDNLLHSLRVDDVPIFTGEAAVVVDDPGGTDDPSAAERLPVNAESILSDDFSSDVGWNIPPAEGQLMLETTAADSVVYPAFINDESQEVARDVYAEAAFQVTETASIFDVGIIIRAQEDRFYYVSVNQSGAVQFNYGEGERVFPIGSTVTIAGLDMQAENRLGVLMLGDYVEIYVNDQFVTSLVNREIMEPGVVALGARTFRNSAGTVTVAWEGIMAVRLTPRPLIAALAEADGAMIGQVQADTPLHLRVDERSEEITTIPARRTIWVLGRTETSDAYFVYSDRHLGWIDAENVTLTINSQPADPEDVFVIERPRMVVGVENVSFGSREALGLDEGGTTVQATPEVTETPSVPQAEASIPATLTGEINNDTPRLVYEFEGEAGMIITITVAKTSGDLDSILQLIGPSGAAVAENDDHNQSLISLPDTRDSALVNVMLPDSGTYIVEISRYNAEVGTSSGTFELNITEAAAPTAEPTPPPASVTLGPGTSVTTEITNEQFELRYSIEAEAGDVVTVSAVTRSGDLDPVIELYAPDGTLMASNDDHNTSLINLPNTRDSALVNITLPTAGTYTLRVSRYNFSAGITTGTVEVQLTQ